MYDEAELTNFLLNSLLKTASSPEDKPYNYNPRHHTKDPEYAHSGPEMKEFKRGFPAPDVTMLRHREDEGPHRELSGLAARVGTHISAPARRLREKGPDLDEKKV